MKRLSFKIVFIALSMILISGCSAKSVKSEPENFQFQVNDTWKIQRWLDASGSLKITEKIDSRNYRGALTIFYVKRMKDTELIRTVEEQVDISVNGLNIKMEGKEVKGASGWSLDRFQLRKINKNLLRGKSIDKRGYGSFISFVRDNSSDIIIPGDLNGTWYISVVAMDKPAKKLPFKKFKFEFSEDKIKVKCILADKHLIMDMGFSGEFRLKDNYLFMSLKDFDFSAELDNQDPEVMKLETSKVLYLREMIKRNQEAYKEHFRTKILKDMFKGEVISKLIKLDKNRIEVRKETYVFIIKRK